VLRQARRGLEFIAALPADLLDASSTLREMFGIWLFIATVCGLLRGGRHLVVLDNLGGVAILGGVVPAFARGGRVWGEYVSGGSPNPQLQRFALAIHDLQEAGDFALVPLWRPRTENVRADFLSRVSTQQLHDYRLRPAVFSALDAAWGPHTIDRFATRDSCQALQPPPLGAVLRTVLSSRCGVDRCILGPVGRGGELGVPSHSLRRGSHHGAPL
jgi:hypothetical protein